MSDKLSDVYAHTLAGSSALRFDKTLLTTSNLVLTYHSPCRKPWQVRLSFDVDIAITYNYMPGVLAQVDPSIKAILVKIDKDHGFDFIIEDIDDEHVMIKTGKQDALKALLKDVSFRLRHYATIH